MIITFFKALIVQISRKELTSAYKFGIHQVYLVVFHFLWIKHIAEASILPEKIFCAQKWRDSVCQKLTVLLV